MKLGTSGTKPIRRKSRNTIKATRLAASDSPENAVEALKVAMTTIDKAASKGTLHRKTASRRISRLSRHVFKAQAGGEA